MTKNSENTSPANSEDETRPQRPMSAPSTSEENKTEFLEGFLNPSEQSDIGPKAEEKGLEFKIVDAIQTIYDPEIPVNIYELGLIYSVEVSEGNAARVVMTLTTPHCPVAETMPGLVKQTVEAVENVTSVTVDLVWEPPWDPSMMSEAAQLELGFL